MKVRVFSIFDDKAASYGQPFFMAHDGLALRAFQDLVNDGKSMVSKHPSDFSLYRLGEFDDNSGTFVNAKNAPEFIAKAINYVPVKEVSANGKE